jgi:hypothetical protein
MVAGRVGAGRRHRLRICSVGFAVVEHRVIAYVQLLGKGPSALNPGVAEGLVPLLLPVQLQVAKSISGQCVMSDGTLKQAA